MYTLYPYRNIGNGVERCDHDMSDLFRICRVETDGTETPVIDYEFEDSAEMVSQWANATKQLGRLTRGEI
jgi:hypothetical protein